MWGVFVRGVYFKLLVRESKSDQIFEKSGGESKNLEEVGVKDTYTDCLPSVHVRVYMLLYLRHITENRAHPSYNPMRWVLFAVLFRGQSLVICQVSPWWTDQELKPCGVTSERMLVFCQAELGTAVAKLNAEELRLPRILIFH